MWDAPCQEIKWYGGKNIRKTIPHWKQICPTGGKFCRAWREINIFFSRPAHKIAKKIVSFYESTQRGKYHPIPNRNIWKLFILSIKYVEVDVKRQLIFWYNPPNMAKYHFTYCRQQCQIYRIEHLFYADICFENIYGNCIFHWNPSNGDPHVLRDWWWFSSLTSLQGGAGHVCLNLNFQPNFP